MKKYSILTMVLCVFMSFTCMAQTKKAGTAQRKQSTVQKKSSTPQKKASASQTVVNDGAEISFSGHIDHLILGQGSDATKLPIDKNVKATYSLKLFRDPTDRTRPIRKTAILTCDIDWKALGQDKDVPCDWSWSGKTVEVVKQDQGGNTGYAVMDGNRNVAIVLPNFKADNGKVANLVFLYGGGNQLAGLRQGMHIDDVARHIQAEIPGTRVVITGKKVDGFTEYVLLSFGEEKVYDVTGDYHYELTNDEPYFTFWTDSKDKLVKWFALKRVR